MAHCGTKYFVLTLSACMCTALLSHDTEYAEGTNDQDDLANYYETLKQAVHAREHPQGRKGLLMNPRVPKYMMQLYKEVAKGKKKLPNMANTVSSFTPLPESWKHSASFLLFNLTKMPDDKIISASLHVLERGRGHSKPLLQPSRLLLYHVTANGAEIENTSKLAAVMTDWEDVDITPFVKKFLKNSPPSGLLVGVAIERQRGGAWGRLPTRKWRKHYPIILIYSKDPVILDFRSASSEARNAIATSSSSPEDPQSSRRKRAITISKPTIGLSLLPAFQNSSKKDTNALDFPFQFPELASFKGKASTRRLMHKKKKKKKKQKIGKASSRIIPYPENYHMTRRERRRQEKEKRKSKSRKNRIGDVLSDRVELNSLSEQDSGWEDPGGRCHKEDLYVAFDDLKWDQFILAPQGYHANYCAGLCPSAVMDATWSNHAIVLRLYHLLGLLRRAPASACVPDKMDPLSILYVDAEGRIVLRTFADMIVKSCICQ